MNRLQPCDALLAALAAILGANYWLHLRGRPTICCRLRWLGHTETPAGAYATERAVRGFADWFVPHLLDPGKRPVR